MPSKVMILGLGEDLQQTTGKEYIPMAKSPRIQNIIDASSQPKPFLVLGNGSSGTSLLRGLLNAHSKCDVWFEKFVDNIPDTVDLFNNAIQKCKDEGKLWGNKIPLERLLWNDLWGGWDTLPAYFRLTENYYVLWITRNYHDYKSSMFKRHTARFTVFGNGQGEKELKRQWVYGTRIRDNLKDRYPDRVKLISFENLVSDTENQLIDVCNFLNLEYEKSMMEGTKDTGHAAYNQESINTDILDAYKDNRPRHFFILGNGHSGSSLLRGLLHAHSEVEVAFEDSPKKRVDINTVFEDWANKRDRIRLPIKIWGDKIPLEQFLSAQWTDDMILRIIDEGYYIVWLQRRFSKYNEPTNNTRKTEEYKKRWDWGRDLYWKFKERHPTKIIQVSFESLLARPKSELMRICDFLGIKYEEDMIVKGPAFTGHFRYKKKEIDKTRI